MRNLISSVWGFIKLIASLRWSRWIVLTLALVPIYFLSKATQLENVLIFEQLAVLYAIDSLFFFLTERVNAKMGTLTLIFLFSMEVIVTIFYCLTIYSAGRYI